MRGLKTFFLCILFLVLAIAGFAQSDSLPPQTPATPSLDPDSIVSRDSIRLAALARQYRDSVYADSVQKAAIPVVHIDTGTYRSFAPVQWLPLDKDPQYMIIEYRVQPSKDELFYLIAGVILLLACIRAGFSKYFRNMFLLFRQTTLRQKQTRDQLLQDNLASLLTNFLFVVTAALYLTLLISYKGWSDLPFWWLAGGSAAVLLLVYLGKYLFLVFSGWLFNAKEAVGSYTFVVFLVNKVLGVILVPFILVLAFASPELVQVAITVSVALVLLLLGYRYGVSFLSIRGKLKVNALHFLLYLCAVEILPLALIWKVLTNYFNGSL